MRTHLLTGVLALLCVSAPAISQAGIFFDLVNYEGGLDGLDFAFDESASVVRDLNSNGVFDTGDVLQGVFQIGTVNATPVSTASPTGGTMLGVFALEVTGFTANAGNTVISLGTVSAANSALSVTSILGAAGISTAGLTSVNGSIDTSIALISRTDGTFAFNGMGLNGNNSSTLGLTNVWSVDFLAGFDTDDDFYQVSVDGFNGAAPPAAPVGSPIISTEIGEYNTAFTVRAADFKFPTNFEPLSTTDFFGNSADADFILAGNGTVGTRTQQTPTGFTLIDDGIFVAQIVPEAGSLLVWGGLASLAGIAGVVRRRRNA